MRARWALAGLLVLVLVPLAPGLPAAPAYRYEADDCAYLYWLAPTASAEAWREHVPERFAMVGEETGTVVAVVTFVECTFQLNGGAPERATIGDVGVTILPPTGTMGTLDFFHLWQITDSPAIAELNAAWGIPGELVDPTFVPATSFALPAVTLGYGSVSSALGVYGGTGFHSPPHEASPGTAVWWRETEGGLLRIEQAFLPGLVEADGVGEVYAQRGPLAQLLPDPNLPLSGGTPAVTSVSYTDLLGGASVVPE